MNQGEVKEGKNQGPEKYQTEEYISESLLPWRKLPIEDIYGYISFDTHDISKSHHPHNVGTVIDKVISPQGGLAKEIPH